MGHRFFEVHHHLEDFCNFDNSILNFILASDLIEMYDVKQELIKWKEFKLFKDIDITINYDDCQWIDTFNAKHGMKYVSSICVDVPSAFEYMLLHNVWKNLWFFNSDNEVVQEKMLPQDAEDQRFKKYYIFCDNQIPTNILNDILFHYKQ